MTAFANREDQPQPWKPKRCIFYRIGLKIYGQIPMRLQMLLDAEFVSSSFSMMGGRVFVPSMEQNFTVVPYRQADGKRHDPESVEALRAWLGSDAGYEFAFAAPSEFNCEIRGINMRFSLVETWLPPEGAPIHQFFLEEK